MALYFIQRLILCCFVIFAIGWGGLSHAEVTSFQLSVYESDSNHKSSVAEVIKQGQFSHLLGSSFKQDEWLKIAWNKNHLSGETVLINDSASQAIEDYYLIKNNTVIGYFQSGHERKFNRRPISHVKSVIPINDADYVLYKPCCNSSFPTYFRLLSPAELEQDEVSNKYWYIVAYTVIGVMFLYNLLIFIYLREKQHLFYCYHLFALGLFHTGWSGLGKQFLWPELTQTQAILTFSTVNSTIASMLFVLAYLNPKNLSLFNRKLMWFVIGLNLLPLLFYLLSSVWGALITLSNISTQLFAMLAWFVTDYVILHRLLKGDRSSRWLLISYLAMNIAGIVSVLRYNGIITNNFFSEQAILLAIVFEALVLSLALAQKIQLLRNEKLEAERAKSQGQRHFSQRLLHLQEEERKKLGDILHDGFTHKLLNLKYDVEDKLGKDTVQSALVVDVLDGMRDLSHMCHPHMLEQLGLKPALLDMIERTNKYSSLEISATIDNLNLNYDQSLLLYRVVQTALNNVIQHANASECLIAVQEVDSTTVKVVIKDDGDGFDVNAKTDGLGMKTLRERSQILSGKLNITSNAEGSTVTLIFPLVRGGSH